MIGFGGVKSEGVDQGFQDYYRATRTAGLKAYREAAKIIAKDARKLAPKSKKHRSRRSYEAGGKVYDEPKRLRATIRRKVRRANDKKNKPLLALIKSIYGYSNMVAHKGTRNRKRNLFLKEALKMNIPKVIPLLKKYQRRIRIASFREQL